MAESLQHSSESCVSYETPLPRRRRQTSAQSESLMGSYMTSRFPNRFNSTSLPTKAPTNLQASDSVEIVSSSLLLQMPSGTSWWAGVIIMTNCTIGMGLLNFPRAVHNAGGIVNAMAIQIVSLTVRFRGSTTAAEAAATAAGTVTTAAEAAATAAEAAATAVKAAATAAGTVTTAAKAAAITPSTAAIAPSTAAIAPSTADCTKYSSDCTKYSSDCTKYSSNCTKYSSDCTKYSSDCTKYSRNPYLQSVLGLIVASLYMVARCSQHYACVSYQDMVTSHIGNFAGQVCRVLIFLNNFGACIVILVVLGDQFEMLMNMIYDIGFCGHWYMRRKFFVPMASACIILPLCLLKRFDFFKYISFLGVLAAVYIAFGVGLTRAITGVQGVTPTVRFASPVTSQIITLVPVICFAYECHVELPPMYACLKRQDMPYTMRLVIGYVVMSFVVYTVGGIGGYATLGETVAGDFLLAYPRNDQLIIVAMALISMKGITTYPVIFYCVRSVMDDVWRRFLRRPQLLMRETPRRVTQTLLVVGLTVVIAIFVPSISVVIGLIGGVSSCFVFLFPGLCFMRMHLRHAGGSRLGSLAGASFVVIGAFLLGSTSASAVADFLQGGSDEPVLCD